MDLIIEAPEDPTGEVLTVIGNLGFANKTYNHPDTALTLVVTNPTGEAHTYTIDEVTGLDERNYQAIAIVPIWRQRQYVMNMHFTVPERQNPDTLKWEPERDDVSNIIIYDSPGLVSVNSANRVSSTISMSINLPRFVSSALGINAAPVADNSAIVRVALVSNLGTALFSQALNTLTGTSPTYTFSFTGGAGNYRITVTDSNGQVVDTADFTVA